uniref:Uncharacterized protein n=1 Tax=Glossina austeni TaxID=7395 RepID=A0A1A9UYG1_GLOAU
MLPLLHAYNFSIFSSEQNNDAIAPEATIATILSNKQILLPLLYRSTYTLFIIIIIRYVQLHTYIPLVSWVMSCGLRSLVSFHCDITGIGMEGSRQCDDSRYGKDGGPFWDQKDFIR